jgi:uncharacterized protein (TIGR02118 family)
VVKYVVLYEGRPEDPEEFDRYYLDHHVPTVARWPGIRRIEVNRGTDGGDFYQLCEFYFDSLDDLRTALASPERDASGRDRLRFPTFNGEIRHQAIKVHDCGLRGGV